MSIETLISAAHAEASAAGRVLIAEMGLSSGRSVTLAVSDVSDGIVRGLSVSPALADAWLASSPQFRGGQVRLPIEVSADRVDAVIRLKVKPKRLEKELLERLEQMSFSPG